MKEISNSPVSEEARRVCHPEVSPERASRRICFLARKAIAPSSRHKIYVVNFVDSSSGCALLRMTKFLKYRTITEIKTDNAEKILSSRYSLNDGWKAIICALIISLFFAGTAHARATVESLPQVEKMFLQGKYDRVVSESSKLIDSGAHGREELFYLKGLSQIQLARFRDARKTFEYMVERYPKGKRAFDGYIGVGDAFFLEGKYAESISSYNDALTNYPDNKNASIGYYKIGSAYHRLGSLEKAREYFDKVKNGSPLSFESKMIPNDLSSPSVRPIAAAIKPFSKPDPLEESDQGDYFYVQAGYFKSRNNAEGLVKKLKQKGYDSYLSTQISPVRNSEISNGVRSGAAFYRVKVGRFNTKSEAEAAASKLKSNGYKIKVCR